MAADKAGQPEPLSERKLLALVVDDEPDIRLMLDLFLRNMGYQVSSADSAHSALEIVRNEARAFDLIVSDIGLPGMDGYQLAQSLRGLHGYSKTLIIAVTGFVEYADRARSLQAGFDERLTKPINFDALIKLIKRFNLMPCASKVNGASRDIT
jgi:CheY-like chemotaxis protein